MAENVQKKSIVKKWWFWVIVVCVVAIAAATVILTVFVKSWPSKSEYAKMLPKPDFGVITGVEENYTNDDGTKGYLFVKMSIKNESDFNNYVKACKDKGFTVDAVEGNTNKDDAARRYFSAKNSDGYSAEIELVDFGSGSTDRYTMTVAVTNRAPQQLNEAYSK